MRQREDDVDVARRKQFLPARFDPTVAGAGLALGAVPVPTGVVRDGAMPATGTRIQMSAERSRATTLDGCQDLAVLVGKPLAAAFDEWLSCSADEIGHLQGWPAHLCVPGRLAFLCDW